MANGFLEALRGAGARMGGALQEPIGRFREGVRVGGLGASPGGQMILEQELAERQRREMEERMNPLRMALLEQLQGSAGAFAGGPPSEFVPQGAQTTPLQGQPAAEPVDPRQSPDVARAFQSLPRDMRVPPDIDVAIQNAATRHGVPANALRAIAAQESGGHGFRRDVVGETPIDLPGQEGDRALGVFQFTPETAREMGIDPRDPVQAADATAKMLRRELDRGSSIEEALTAHFGGPERALWGPRTQKYRQDIARRFRQYEKTVPGGQFEPSAMQPVDGGPMAQAAEGQVGPFGNVGSPQAAGSADFGHQLLQIAAQDPAQFAQMFAGEGGIEQIMSLMRGGSPVEQTRVISGDSGEGRSIGLQPGERARVKGQMSPGGTFVPSEVVARPFREEGEAAGGGPLINLYDYRNDEVLPFRRDDPEVDRLISQPGYIVTTDAQALDAIRGMTQKTREELEEAQIRTKNYIASAGDMIEMLNADPDINTFVARGAAIINDFRQESKAFARASGIEFDESVLDLSVHEDTFRRLGIQRERMQSLITSLAFQRAAAESGVGRITNQMMQRFIEEIGGNTSHSDALALVISDTAQRAARAFHNRWEVKTGGAPFEGDLGMEDFPIYQPREQFPGAPARAPAAPSPAQGAGGGAPAGVDPGLWEFMTPEERALWQN